MGLGPGLCRGLLIRLMDDIVVVAACFDGGAFRWDGAEDILRSRGDAVVGGRTRSGGDGVRLLGGDGVRVCGGVGRKDDGGGVRAREVAGVERLDMMANSSSLAPKRLSPHGPVTDRQDEVCSSAVLEGGCLADGLGNLDDDHYYGACRL